jgi:hypothetical protein
MGALVLGKLVLISEARPLALDHTGGGCSDDLQSTVSTAGINDNQFVGEGNAGQGTLDRTRIVKRQHVGRDWSHKRARLTGKGNAIVNLIRIGLTIF